MQAPSIAGGPKFPPRGGGSLSVKRLGNGAGGVNQPKQVAAEVVALALGDILAHRASLGTCTARFRIAPRICECAVCLIINQLFFLNCAHGLD
jgi:hypothetical protein